jgi:hypothetical protein
MEQTMNKTHVEARELSHEETGQGIAQAGTIILLALAGLIGIWGIACMLGAVATGEGPAEMVRGYITAITGM